MTQIATTTIETIYHVVITDHREGIKQLSISRLDGKPIGDWNVLQYLKNKHLGDRVAIEIYPRKKYKIDNAHEYHLFYMPKLNELDKLFGQMF